MQLRIRILAAWIVYGAATTIAGWAMSAVGQLNPLGFGIAAAAAVIVALLVPRAPLGGTRLLSRRWRKPLPIIFFSIASLALIGGALHAPSNYDMLTYRLPRLLHWAWQDRWHWIHTTIDRMNYSGCAFEWATTPLFMITHSSRLFFVLNGMAFLLLPGLVFGVFRQLGVGRRVAWVWMWLLPSGYCFAMQAGSGGNDTISGTYLLASLFFAGKARQSHRPVFAYLSIVAAALLSAVKASNLPLLLPCAVALLPSAKLMIAPARRSFTTLAVVAVALACSFLPTAILNGRHTGDWTGSPGDPGKLRAGSALAGIIGNSYAISWAGLEPPLLPVPQLLNRVIDASVPTPARDLLRRDFPRFSAGLGELPAEEHSGLGLGVTLSALTMLVASLLLARGNARQPAKFLGLGIILSGVIALLAFMISLASDASARLASPYYPLLLAGCAVFPGAQQIARMWWWRALTLLSAASIIPALILTPSRPLWPAQTTLARLRTMSPDSRLISRAQTVYKVYSRRADSLAPVRDALPSGCTTVGLICGDDESEVSLWKPWGSRRILHVTRHDDMKVLRQRGIQCLVVSAEGLQLLPDSSLAGLLRQTGGEVVFSTKLVQKVQSGEQDWFVIRLLPV